MEKRIDALTQGLCYLSNKGVTNPEGEAEIFLSHVLNCSRIDLYLNNQAVAKEKLQHFWSLLTNRAKGHPLQYLIRSSEFMGLQFKLSPGVFIPRPETEILVGTVIETLTGRPADGYSKRPTILDIGTGCGNINISIAKYLEKTHIFACDICDSALQLTRENAHLNKVKIYLVKSDLFGAFGNKNYFSLIVSNPPYIRAEQIPKLSRELQHEPRQAYDGGADGLFYYRKIINEAADYLQHHGLLALEIGDNQAQEVQKILLRARRLLLIKVVKDYNDTERVIVAQKIR